jgi:hemerythrin-like metal-binding protein
MAFIDWKPEYALGVALLDEQHARLADRVNGAADAIERGENAAKIAALLAELLDDTEQHFQLEEQLMYQHFYVSRLPHKETHLSLLLQLKKLKDDFAAAKPYAASGTRELLRRWLLDHLFHADRALAAHLRGRGVR